MKDESINIISSFRNSILNDGLEKITENISETVIDSILNDGFLKDIPIIGTSIGLYKIGASLRARNEIKKLCRFLFQLHTTSQKERNDFTIRIEDEEGRKNELFERVLYIIERLDDIEKAEIVGKLFKNLMKDMLRTDDFLRLSTIIDKTYLTDLKYLDLRFNINSVASEESKISFIQTYNSEFLQENLKNAGLLKKERIEDKARQRAFGGNEKIYRDTYKLTAMGYMLVENGF